MGNATLIFFFDFLGRNEKIIIYSSLFFILFFCVVAICRAFVFCETGNGQECERYAEQEY
jgi:hypothetical protein